MKHIKKYENIIDDIKVGDYIICEYHSNIKINEFTRNNIGVLTKIDNGGMYEYIVKYDNIPDIKEITDETLIKYKNSFMINREEILYYSENKIYLETILNAIKFNL